MKNNGIRFLGLTKNKWRRNPQQLPKPEAQKVQEVRENLKIDHICFSVNSTLCLSTIHCDQKVQSLTSQMFGLWICS